MTITSWLMRRYPRRWRDRYGEELAQLVVDLSPAQDRWRLALDVGRGAIDAHTYERLVMKRFDAAWRRGIRDGLIIAGLIAVLVVFTNVIFPPGPDESDGDPEYLWQYLAALIVLAALLIAVGARARRQADGAISGVKAGAAAGVIIGAAVTVTFLVVNNLFLDIVSRQHDKRVAFAASGWTSMRAYLTVTQIAGGLFLVPALAVVGAVLGLIGAAVFRPRTASPKGVTAQPQ
jgi:hypothetical protein